MSGFIWLVGAGCARRDLLTLAGRDCLQAADAVVYDDLLPDGLLDWAAPGAELHYMGKRQGRHSASQTEINDTLIALAKAGKTVCRLKGGDPFVFGRGGEEALALQAAGVPFAVVPGVTSAVAVPELWGIPVTHRGVSRSFHVVTGHTSGSADGLPEDLDKLAGLSGTLVFLMGLSRLDILAQRLIAAGKDPATPAAVVGETVVRGDLAHIAALAKDFPPPAVIVVGDTAALSLTAARPLDGVRVGLTGTAGFQNRLRTALAPYGGQVLSLQTSQVQPACSAAELSAALGRAPAWVAFTSPNGPEVFFQLLRTARLDLRGLGGVKFAAIGPGTAKALEQYGVFADLVPVHHDTAALGAALAEQGQGPVLLAGAENASAAPETALTDAGVAWERLSLYRLAPGPVRRELVDYLLLGSAGGAENYLAAGGLPPRLGCVCIGAHTARRAAALGLPVAAESRDTTGANMVRALLDLRREISP